MSAKLRYHPTPVDRSPVIDNTSLDGLELLFSRVRRIQADAGQICNVAVEIEDARLLAEKVMDTCRRILDTSNGTTAAAHPTSCMQAEQPAVAVRGFVGSAEPSNGAAARAKLESLSARELEIFTHLAEGRSAAQIAVRLSRSSKTINNHRTRILQKLGVKNATELVRLALQSGLVSV